MEKDKDFDLLEVVSELWSQKTKLAAAVAISFLASLIYAFSLPDFYSSNALLAPREAESGGLGSIAGQVGGLANLAGISLGGSGGADAMIAIETLKSKTFFRDRIYGKVLPELMAVEAWKADTNELIYVSLRYEPVKKKWNSQPSAYSAYKKFIGKHLRLSQDKGSGLVTVRVEHESPHIAKKWVQILVEEVNASLREKAIAEADNSIVYLQQQLKNNTLVNVNQTLSLLIEEQFRTIMLAQATDEYVFRVIDEPIVDRVPARPKRSQLVIVGSVVGFIFSILFILTKYLFSKFSLVSGRSSP